MDRLSNNKKSKKLMFFELIKHNIAFDYLLGVFVCVFKRDMWEKNIGVVNQELIQTKEHGQILKTLVFILKFSVKHLLIRSHIFYQNSKCEFIWCERMGGYLPSS